MSNRSKINKTKSFDSDELYNNCNSDPKLVTCSCGKTSFTIFNGRVRKARECACIDCYQHVIWAQSKDGPQVPPILSAGYWDNDIRVESGEENIMVILLRKDARAKRTVAKCCYSTLMIDHPGYKQLRFGLYENTCSISWDNDSEPPSITRPPSDRIFMKDWNASRGKLPEFSGDPLRIDQRVGLPFHENVNRQSIDNPMGETCQSLFRRLPWFSLDVKEGFIPKDKNLWPNLKPVEPHADAN